MRPNPLRKKGQPLSNEERAVWVEALKKLQGEDPLVKITRDNQGYDPLWPEDQYKK